MATSDSSDDPFYGDSDDSRSSFKKNALVDLHGHVDDDESLVDDDESLVDPMELDTTQLQLADEVIIPCMPTPIMHTVPSIVTKVLAHNKGMYKKWFRFYFEDAPLRQRGAYCCLCSSPAGLQYQKTQSGLKRALPWVQVPCQNVDLLDACRKHEKSDMHVYLNKLPAAVTPLQKIIIRSKKTLGYRKKN